MKMSRFFCSGIFYFMCNFVETLTIAQLFCRDRSSNIKFPANLQCIAIRDINPQALVHILIIPKKHIQQLSSAEDADEQVTIYSWGRGGYSPNFSVAMGDHKSLILFLTKKKLFKNDTLFFTQSRKSIPLVFLTKFLTYMGYSQARSQDFSWGGRGVHVSSEGANF